MCVSPTIPQSRKLFEELYDLIADTGVVSRKNEVQLKLTFINGSSIVFKSAEQKNGLRGFTIDLLVIDEAAYIPDSVFDTLQPTTDVKRANIVLFSTPAFTQGFYYRYFTQGMLQANNCYSIDWATYDTSQFLSNEKLEVYRRTVPHLTFLTEYLGQFIEGEGTVFSSFKDCVKNISYKGEDTSAGIDWATCGDDNTVITIINAQKQVVHIEIIKDLDTMQTINKICQIFNKYKVQKAIVEKNSIGQTYSDLLCNKIGDSVEIERFTTTNDSKRKLIDTLAVAFQNKEIVIPNNETLLAELSFYQATAASNGTIKYNAKTGHHDDTVMSLAFAYKAVNFSNYNIL